MTVLPFSRRKCLIWDSTCVDSFSLSALALTAIEPASAAQSAAQSAEVCKNHKYEGLCDQYIFQVIAVESSGVIGQDTDTFNGWFGHLNTSISREGQSISGGANNNKFTFICHKHRENLYC